MRAAAEVPELVGRIVGADRVKMLTMEDVMVAEAPCQAEPPMWAADRHLHPSPKSVMIRSHLQEKKTDKRLKKCLASMGGHEGRFTIYL